MEYQVWTTRTLLLWAPPVLMLLGWATYVSLALTVSPQIHAVNALVILATIWIVVARHRMHVGIRDSITEYLLDGTRLAVRSTGGWNAALSDAVERGLREALERCCERFPSREDDMRESLSTAFVVIQDEVYMDTRRRAVKVGGLTYYGGPMVLEFRADLYQMEDLACHEAVHACLNAIGVDDSYGAHHNVYSELFVPIDRERGK